MKTLWKEPLLHFLLIGIVLFAVYDFRQEDSGETPGRILVTAGQVDQFSARFQRTWLRPPTNAELAGLIEGHVRDEVYYREARDMGLDQDDAMVRQRMRLKLEFLLEDLTSQVPPTDEQLLQFMQAHPDKYQQDPQFSFTQVYLNPEQHPDLEVDAAELLTLLKNGTQPESAGDRSFVEQEYTLTAQYDIARIFGEDFAQQLAGLEPGGWTGPISSGYGIHLVKITAKQVGRSPQLSEIRDEVEQDYQYQRRQELNDIAYGRLRENYEVVIEDRPAPGSAMAGAGATPDPSTP